MARVPCRFEACLGTANKRAVTTQLNHRARCLNGAPPLFERSMDDFSLSFSLFILSFFGCERNKEEVNFPFILSRIPFSFFCARVDASLLLLAKRNGEIFPREMQFKLDFGKFTK